METREVKTALCRALRERAMETESETDTIPPIYMFLPTDRSPVANEVLEIEILENELDSPAAEIAEPTKKTFPTERSELMNPSPSVERYSPTAAGPIHDVKDLTTQSAPHDRREAPDMSPRTDVEFPINSEPPTESVCKNSPAPFTKHVEPISSDFIALIEPHIVTESAALSPASKFASPCTDKLESRLACPNIEIDAPLKTDSRMLIRVTILSPEAEESDPPQCRDADKDALFPKNVCTVVKSPSTEPQPATRRFDPTTQSSLIEPIPCVLR